MLKTYILRRLAHHEEDQWTEVGVVTLIWMGATDTAHPPSIEPTKLEADLNEVYKSWSKILGSEATHGALVVCGNPSFP